MKSIPMLVLLVSLAAGSVVAQPGAALVGLLTTDEDRPVRQARVILVDPESGIRRETTTNEEGIYAFSRLPAGRYRLEASKSGFAPLRFEPIVLKVLEKRSLRLRWDGTNSAQLPNGEEALRDGTR